MSDDHLEEHLEAESDFLQQVPIVKPRIFEGSLANGIPAGFDAVTIRLDGRMQAELDWKIARKEASLATEQGFGLMWAIDLGLFTGLALPLTNQGQFLSLALSLEHFRDSLWHEFKDNTLGVSLYRGAADFSLGFPWDPQHEQNLKSWLKESCSLEAELPELRQSQEGRQLLRLFCRDVAVEYLSLLAARLPDTLKAHLFLDMSSFTGSCSDELQYLNPERFDRLQLAIRNARLPFEAMGWGAPTPCGYSGMNPFQLPEPQENKIGVCVPPMVFNRASHYEGFEEALAYLQRLSISYKFIDENSITAKWDGLDYLLYSPSGLSVQGRRKLQGFCAAGGTAVSTGILMGFPQEISVHNLAINSSADFCRGN